MTCANRSNAMPVIVRRNDAFLPRDGVGIPRHPTSTVGVASSGVAGTYRV